MATSKHGLIACALVILGLTTACGGGSAEPEATETAASAAAAVPGRPVDKSAEGDFARNIEQIAAGVHDAKANFADDLVVLAGGTLSRAAAAGLAEELGAAISGKALTPEQAGAVAKAVLAAASGPDAARARTDLVAALTAAGAPADKAAAAGVAASKLGAK